MSGKALVVVVLSLLAGCTAPPAAREDAPVFAPPEPLARDALALAVPDDVPREVLPVEVEVSPVWVKPLRNVTAQANASDGSAVSWYASVGGDDVRVSMAGGHPFLTRWTTPLHDGTRGSPRTPLLIDVRPGDGARAFVVAREGRLTLGVAGTPLVNVTLREDASEEAPSQVFLTGSAGRLRAVPDELDVRPGTRLLVWNAAEAPVALSELRFAAPIGTGAKVDVTPVDDGLFRLEAVSHRGPRALGVASARFLSDFERPNDEVAVGPMGGTFAPTGPASDAMRVVAAYPVSTLAINFTRGTSLPDTPLRYEVRAGTATVASGTSPSQPLVVLHDLPAGEYVVHVEPAGPCLVSYDVRGWMEYVLPVPDAVRRA